MIIKVCSKCREAKPTTEYSRDRQKRDGLRPSCKSCGTISSKEYQIRRGRVVARKLRLRNPRSIWLVEYKETNCCEGCTEYYPYYVMQLDHIDPNKKKFEVNMVSAAGSKSDLVWYEEFRKCRLLCANCHLEATFKDKAVF